MTGFLTAAGQFYDAANTASTTAEDRASEASGKQTQLSDARRTLRTLVDQINTKVEDVQAAYNTAEDYQENEAQISAF